MPTKRRNDRHAACFWTPWTRVSQAGFPVQQQAGYCGKQAEGRAYPAVHDELNTLPLELLCGIDGNLAIIGTKDMVMGVHQPHSHNVLPGWQQLVRERAARLHVKQATYAMPSIPESLLQGLGFLQIELCKLHDSSPIRTVKTSRDCPSLQHWVYDSQRFKESVSRCFDSSVHMQGSCPTARNCINTNLMQGAKPSGMESEQTSPL